MSEAENAADHFCAGEGERKRPHSPRMSETEGIGLQRQGWCDILEGMKGWRPSA